MDHLQIINKLIGPINPVGETNTDNTRFENLKTQCELVQQLVEQLRDTAIIYKDSVEFSVKRAGAYADSFLTETIGLTI